MHSEKNKGNKSNFVITFWQVVIRNKMMQSVQVGYFSHYRFIYNIAQFIWVLLAIMDLYTILAQLILQKKQRNDRLLRSILAIIIKQSGYMMYYFPLSCRCMFVSIYKRKPNYRQEPLLLVRLIGVGCTLYSSRAHANRYS